MRVDGLRGWVGHKLKKNFLILTTSQLSISRSPHIEGCWTIIKVNLKHNPPPVTFYKTIFEPVFFKHNYNFLIYKIIWELKYHNIC